MTLDKEESLPWASSLIGYWLISWEQRLFSSSTPSTLPTGIFLGAWRGDKRRHRQDISGFHWSWKKGDSVLSKGFVTTAYPYRPSVGASGEESPLHAWDAQKSVDRAEGNLHLGQVPYQAINSLGPEFDCPNRNWAAQPLAKNGRAAQKANVTSSSSGVCQRTWLVYTKKQRCWLWRPNFL